MIAAAVLAAANVWAQLPAEDYLNQYVRQVRNVGYAGVGVETILDRWAVAYPNDINMLTGRFNYYFAKSQSTQVVAKGNLRTFMGNKPVMSLKDSTGATVNYFEEYFFDDEYFAAASKALDKAISLEPENIDLRFNKISSLIAYEKESPDMTEAEIMKMIDSPFGGEQFPDIIQEYCGLVYSVGSPRAYEVFRAVSERMSGLYPRNTNFITNLGTCAMVADKNWRKAIKIYDKALKINPSDEVALKNKAIAEKMLKASKTKKK